MRKIICCVLLLTGITAFGQYFDSTAYDKSRKKIWDNRLVMDFSFDMNRARLGTLNEDLKAQGFKPLPQYFNGVSFGVSALFNRNSFSFAGYAASRETTSNELTYSLSTGGFSIDRGYALLYTGRCRFAPFLGIAFESIVLEAKKDSLLDITGSLLPARTSSQKGQISRTDFPVYGGADLDFLLLGGKPGHTFVMLGARTAYYLPVFKTRYKSDPEGNTYKPDIFVRNLVFSVHLRMGFIRPIGNRSIEPSNL